MLINYFSFMYFAYLFIVIFICAILYLIARKESTCVKKVVVLFVALLNVAQHIFKGKIYPQYNGNAPLHISTAYNICAFLILVSPFIILFGNDLLKNFLTYIGSFAGMIAMLVPYWFIGETAFSWEVYRFYICHGLLFISSFLPCLLGLHTLKLCHCWKIVLLFFIALVFILANNAILIKTGNYPDTNPNDILGELIKINPGWAMGPSPSMPWIEDVVALFTPSFFLGNNPWNMYIPILWYAIPLYLGGTALIYFLYGISRIVKKQESH